MQRNLPIFVPTVEGTVLVLLPPAPLPVEEEVEAQKPLLDIQELHDVFVRK